MLILKKFLTKNEIVSLNNLIKAIQEKQITVTTVGLYNHGKSTLLNVLIGDFENKTFKTADVRETIHSKSVVHNDIKYVDTPGLNAQKEDDNKVMEAIQSSDIILFVHSITTGEFNKKEIDFLNEIKQYWQNPKEFIDRTIFILSRIDNISNSDDIEKTSKRIQEQIKEIFNTNCMICPLSAKDYAEGMLENEMELIFESNIKELKKGINLLVNKSKKSILKTKRRRFENKINELELKLNKKLKSNQAKIKKLKEEEAKKDKELKEDISKIENTLKSMYERLS